MKVSDVELDQDAERFLDEIVNEMVTTFGATREGAVARVAKAVIESRPHLLPGPQSIVGDHLIYHCAPEYWAGSIWHGRRDWWRSRS